MPLPPRRPRVYLAGPDVFLPDAAERFKDLVRFCESLGLEPLAPSDSASDHPMLAAGELARRIYKANMDLLSGADGVVANLQPFRGFEPDPGTVFEVGVAVARGIPVVAYGVPDGTYADRFRSESVAELDAKRILRDSDGVIVEDFGLPLNLMLSCSIELAQSASSALARLADLINQPPAGDADAERV